MARGGSVKPADIALFTRQMATMMRAGVPLVQAFDIVADGLDKPKVADLVRTCATTLPAVARLPPRCASIRCISTTCSATWSTPVSIRRPRDDARPDRHLQRKDRVLESQGPQGHDLSHCGLVVAFIVSGILLIKVVPQFEEVFRGFGAELPAFTQMVITSSEFTQAYWYFIVLRRDRRDLLFMKRANDRKRSANCWTGWR